MKITSKDIKDSKQNRNKFNKYYNDAVIDVITLKNDCNMSMKEIQDATPYEIDFINFVFENYDINKFKVKDENDYVLMLKINEHNINIEKLKEARYSEELITEVLNPEEEGTKYYFSK